MGGEDGLPRARTVCLTKELACPPIVAPMRDRLYVCVRVILGVDFEFTPLNAFVKSSDGYTRDKRHGCYRSMVSRRSTAARVSDSHEAV